MNPPKIHIKSISALETHAVRHPVLRPGLPRETCVFDGDEVSDTLHLGAFLEYKIIGVLTLMTNPPYACAVVPNVQLRGMAVLDTERGKGIGAALVKAAERRVEQQKIGLLWMNARRIAVPFYQKMGYIIEGPGFDIPIAGPHHYMTKHIL